MAKIQYSSLIESLTGHVSGGTAQKQLSGNVLIASRNIIKHKSSYNESFKALLSYIISAWNILTSEQVYSWNNNHGIFTSGRNLFINRNFNILLCGKSLIYSFVPSIYVPFPDFFNIMISKFYNSIILTSLFNIPANYYIKIKASPQYRNWSTIHHPTYKQIIILSSIPTLFIDLAPYYLSIYKQTLKPGFSIFFEISLIDSNDGSQSLPFIKHFRINNYFDILFGSGSASGPMRRTSDNFSTINQLDLVSGSTYAYIVQLFNDNYWAYIAYGAGKIRITDNNGISFIDSVTNSLNLNNNNFSVFPNGYASIWGFTTKKMYISKDYCRTWSTFDFPVTVNNNTQFTQISSNKILIQASSSVAGHLLFLCDLQLNNLVQCNVPVNFTTSSITFCQGPDYLIVGVNNNLTHLYLLRSTDGGLTWLSVFDYSGTSGVGIFLNIDNVNLIYQNYSSRKIITSDNAGISWTDRGNVFSTGVSRMFIKFSNSNICSFNSGIAGIYLSQDNGVTWSNIYLEGANTNIFYALQLSGTCAICWCVQSLKVLITYDSGLTFNQIGTVPNNNYVNSALLNNHYLP